jgi:uncharacterized membrane protein YfcA
MVYLIAAVIGILAGVLGGAFGIGGGILIVPALIALLGYSQLKAQGTSLVALLAPVGILALIQYYQRQEVDLKVGAVIAGGFFAGGFLGSKIALTAGDQIIRKGFAGFLICVGIYMLLQKH